VTPSPRQAGHEGAEGTVLLQAEQVSAAYGSHSVLETLNLQVRRGELVGLIGPNGSGKTTLLHVCSGYHPVRSGRVLLGGEPVSSLDRAAVARHLAFLPQQTHAIFPYSALEMVLMGRHPYAGYSGLDSAEDVALAEGGMAQLDIFDLAPRPFNQLSGGEQQLVLLARAFAQAAPLLMLDEPLNGLDLRHQLQLLRAIRAQVSAGCGALATFHDLAMAARFCDRLVLLSHGRVYAAGAPQEVLTPAALRDVYGVEGSLQKDAAGNYFFSLEDSSSGKAS